jgi:hypothetical protein
VLKTSLPRAFWSGLTGLAEGLGIVRNLVTPVALPRVGPAPRPIAPPGAGNEPAVRGAAARSSAADLPPEGDPDEPPPIVRRS